GVRRRVVPDQVGGVGIELERGVAPVGAAVPEAVAGGDEDGAVRRVDDRAGAAPDPRARLRTGRRIDEPRPVAAQGIPHGQEIAGRAVQDGDVPLVRRRIADVAGGGGDDAAVKVVQGRRDLLASWQQGNRGGPDDAAVRYPQLPDRPIRRGRIYELTVRVGDRGRGRDLCRSRPRGVVGWRVAPQHDAPLGIDGERLAVGRGDEEDVVSAAVHRHAVEVDRGRVHRAVDRDLLPHQGSDVRRRDPCRYRRGVRPAGVPPEARPVVSARRTSPWGGPYGVRRAGKRDEYKGQRLGAAGNLQSS